MFAGCRGDGSDGDPRIEGPYGSAPVQSCYQLRAHSHCRYPPVRALPNEGHIVDDGRLGMHIQLPDYLPRFKHMLEAKPSNIVFPRMRM
jgi:hypothetical protein